MFARKFCIYKPLGRRHTLIRSGQHHNRIPRLQIRHDEGTKARIVSPMPDRDGGVADFNAPTQAPAQALRLEKGAP